MEAAQTLSLSFDHQWTLPPQTAEMNPKLKWNAIKESKPIQVVS